MKRPAHGSRAEYEAVMSLIIGRLLRMGARPTQPGDVEEYERLRRLALDLHDNLAEVRP